MIAFLRRCIALMEELLAEGAWAYYAPPLVIPASSAIWRALPPLRLVKPSPKPAVVPRTDPALVAARRASLRLVQRLNESRA